MRQPGFFLQWFRKPSLDQRQRARLRTAQQINRGRHNNSNVTIVETGFPGKPNTGLPWHIPNTAGFPGRIATASKKIPRPWL